MTAALLARGIHKHFGGVRVLDGVDLRADAGRVTALIGPNGAGKSTLANVVGGFVAADRGSVWLGDREVTRMPIRRRAALGLARTFQTPAVFGGLTVGEEITLAAASSRGVRLRRARGEAAAALERLGLAAWASRPVRSLAYGEAKRLEAARAVAMAATVLVMDEPAAGLSAEAVAGLRDIIGALRADGVAVLLIEHNMPLVMELADHVLVLDGGRAIAGGPPAAVREDPRVIEAYLGVDDD